MQTSVTSDDVEETSDDASSRESLPVDIDWATAASVGRKVARPGPRITGYTSAQARAELIDAAVRAEAPVREVTGLADGLPVPSARVVDRAGWIDAAAQSMPAMMTDETEPATGWSAKLAGAQAGGMLAFLSSAILGQYDPFSLDPETGEPGVLLLVAPNIIGVERQLRVVPSDFRYWVCLHEVTHRVQFSANPWLTGYMRDNVAGLADGDEDSVTELLSRVTESLRSQKPREKGVIGLMQLLQSPEQFAAFERMLLLGTLLEGHADHVMDAVGPTHVPTVDTIRKAFDARRSGPRNPLQRLIRALIGMDAKIAQYVRGKAFVDEVVGTVGMERFNTIWTSPETLPLANEIDDPSAWISRVL
ncbi:zinc-dependent metalloprotease [Gordonia sp. HY442]|uniref:zinc-dependent metalloprotease n=1 Tax=Gordonia zhenghanii TaxID=2911516 RepID=UPI001F3A4F41|nr:zinc-dependent metalloprotease [Gordonia zhenghanii]MCF8604040.1 zinc-dependent metalloprotease [Gordonia zhenghanii]